MTTTVLRGSDARIARSFQASSSIGSMDLNASKSMSVSGNARVVSQFEEATKKRPSKAAREGMLLTEEAEDDKTPAGRLIRFNDGGRWKRRGHIQR